MNIITCGKCAKRLGLSLEERKSLALQLKEGINICFCGHEMIIKNGVYRPL
jgi:hypothetical protein